MKSLTITLLVAIFCVTVSGVNLKDTAPTQITKENNISSVETFEYNFEINRHVRKGSIPSNN